MDMKDILKYAAIGVGIYVVWEYVISPMVNTVTPAPPTGTSSATIMSTGTTTTQQQQTQQTVPVVDNTFTSSDYGTANWQARVASDMAVAAGVQTSNLDNWSFYYQNQANGSPISASLMQNIIDAAGGNRGIMITAPAFIGFLVSAGAANGLSGLGDIVYVGSGLGSFWGVN